MNKLASGAIVGTLGVALLLGGAGTFALWNGSTTVDGATISSGALTIATDSSKGVWRDISTTPAVPIGNISLFKIAPGDTIEMTKVITVVATGTNLKASLTFDPASIGIGNGAAATLNSALKSATTYAFSAADANGALPVTNNVVAIASNAASTNITVKLVVTLPATNGDLIAGVRSQAQGGALDFSAVSLILQQNARS